MGRNFPAARMALRARVKKAESDFLAKGRKATGTLTATQTGAKRVAQMHDELSQAESIMDSVSNTGDFEAQIRGKKRK